MGPMWTRGVSAGGRLGQGLPYVPRDIVPKFPVECPPYEYVAWKRRFEVFIANQGLRHTISPDAPEIAVINCINDAYLFGHFGEVLITDHRLVWGYTSEATAGAPFEDRLYEGHSVSDALRTMREWALPLYPAERHLLVAKLEGVQFMAPKFFFARISRLETTMRAVRIEKNESEIVQIILRQLPERYDVVKTMTMTAPQLSSPKLENTIRSVYSQRKAHEIARQWPAVGVPAEPSNPHALSRGGGMPRQQQQLQQHWSRGGGMPQQQQQLQRHWSCDGSMPRQQQQLQQHWSRDGDMPRQQEKQHYWSRGGRMPRQQQQQHQWSRGSSHVFPPARQARQQQPLQQPPRGIPTIGGDGEDGSGPLCETFFGGDGGAIEERLQSENVEMPMFFLSGGLQQSAPTAVALAAAAPAAEAVIGTSVFPAVSSKGVAVAPTSSASAASAAVPATAPATGATVFPTTLVGGGGQGADETAAPSTGDTAAPDASVEGG